MATMSDWAPRCVSISNPQKPPAKLRLIPSTATGLTWTLQWPDGVDIDAGIEDQGDQYKTIKMVLAQAKRLLIDKAGFRF